MGTYRYDYFQNLDARVNIDPGVAFYVINQPGHRLWFEGGLDLQFDKYRKVEVGKDESVIIVAGRAFAGYAKKFGETAELKTNVEFLQGAYSNTKSTSKQKPQRLIWDTSLAVHLVDALSVAGSFTLRWEKRVPKDESFYPLDTITALSLVYRFL
jgi:putative salt-induced outer membrane protein